VTSTLRRTACSLLLAGAGFTFAGAAAAQDGEGRSSFRPRVEGPPATLLLPVQAKGPAVPSTGSSPGTGSTPGTTPPSTGSTPGSLPGAGSTPGTKPGTGITPGTGTTPGTPGSTPGTSPGTPGTGPGTIPGTGIPLPGTPIPVPPGGGPGTGAGAGPGAGAGIGGPLGDIGGNRPDPYEAYIRLEPPGRERLFGSRDSEHELEERMRQERRDTGTPGDTIQFPERPKITDKSYEVRRFAPMQEIAEPNYVVHKDLLFEEVNAERYGWEFGPIQPLVSTAYFLKDVLLLPNNLAAYPHRHFDTSAGKCQPGDPVPYIVYPPEITWTGLAAEAGVFGLLTVAFP
jgi:hypothetical protein